MVPDRFALSRRQLLGGLAGGVGLGGAGTVATAVTRPTALPDPLADVAVTNYPTPPAASSLWQPTVTEEHAREAVTLLAETDDRARSLWAATELDDRCLTGAGGWLETARSSLENGNYHDALSDATYGMQFAGEDLGKAREELGREDLGELAARSRELFERIDAVVDAIDSYPVREPERDLAWYVHAELELQRGRHLADWHGLEAIRNAGDDDPESSAYDHAAIGETSRAPSDTTISCGRTSTEAMRTAITSGASPTPSRASSSRYRLEMTCARRTSVKTSNRMAHTSSPTRDLQSGVSRHRFRPRGKVRSTTTSSSSRFSGCREDWPTGAPTGTP